MANVNRFIRAGVAIAIAASATLLRPQLAIAAPGTYTFFGSGYGHGLGMSQWGAKGAADAGMSHPQILSHYYQGTSVVAHPMPSAIRVGLVQGVAEISMSADGPFDILVSGVVVRSGGPSQTWKVQRTTSGAFRIVPPTDPAFEVGGPSTGLEIRWGEATLISTLGHKYRYGPLLIDSYGSPGAYVLRAIIHVGPFERYLYGLGEMPSSWNIEALKTQAIAGRTYAIEKMERLGIRQPCNCHLYSTVVDQAYVGYDKELGSFASNWKAAVDQTAGLVSKYAGSLIQAYYSSSSGGHTENNENVWGSSPVAYLRGVPDPWDLNVSPYIGWQVPFTAEQLSTRLSNDASTNVGAIQSVELLNPRGVSGRLLRVIDPSSGGVRLSGSLGVKRVSGDTLRRVLGLRSTLFYLGHSGVGHPDGTLIQGSGTQISILKDGTRWPVPSPRILESQFRYQEVVPVADPILFTYPEAQLGFRDGSLLQTSDSRMWVVSHGLRRYVTADDFTALGYSSGNLLTVTASEAALHQVGDPLQSGNKHPDGALVMDPTGTAYLLEVGTKRRLVSPGVLESSFTWADVVQITATESASYPVGPAYGFREGSLLRTDDGSIWVVSNDYRRHITSQQVFSDQGYNGNMVRSASAVEASLHQVGFPITPGSRHPDGTVFLNGGGQFYVLRDGGRLPIKSALVRRTQFPRDENVSASDATISSYPGAVERFSEGTLIYTSGGAVWVISDGFRRHIPSPTVFSNMGYSWTNVTEVSDGEATYHPVGPALSSSDTHPNGTLVMDPNGNVFYVEKGMRRHVPSPTVFDSRFRWSRVVSVPSAEITRYTP
ncbi:MAG: SpoIID/LytB domain-containing protein, partial [Actinomycetota bacterium]